MNAQPVNADGALILALGVINEMAYAYTETDAEYQLGIAKRYNRALLNAKVISFSDWRVLNTKIEAISAEMDVTLDFFRHWPSTQSSF